jgi:hypothetical protein
MGVWVIDVGAGADGGEHGCAVEGELHVEGPVVTAVAGQIGQVLRRSAGGQVTVRVPVMATYTWFSIARADTLKR